MLKLRVSPVSQRDDLDIGQRNLSARDTATERLHISNDTKSGFAASMPFRLCSMPQCHRFPKFPIHPAGNAVIPPVHAKSRTKASEIPAESATSAVPFRRNGLSPQGKPVRRGFETVRLLPLAFIEVQRHRLCLTKASASSQFSRSAMFFNPSAWHRGGHVPMAWT